MRSSVYEQFAIVREDSASLFTERLNEAIRRLRHYNPTVQFSESDPFCAYVRYVVNENAPESVAEASEIEGVKFVCAQCPYFVPPKREDGEIDKRCKWGDCDHAELGRTYKDSPACNELYELFKERSVKVCFAD